MFDRPARGEMDVIVESSSLPYLPSICLNIVVDMEIQGVAK